MSGILTYLLIPLVFFSQITMHQGLSQNAVFSIAEGKDKNMWFATYGGVTRYDGYRCRNYDLERDSLYTHTVNGVPLVFCDSRGRIWAYDCGLNLFDPEENVFRLCGTRVTDHVTSMAEIPGGDILAVSGGRILRFDAETGKLCEGAGEFYSGGDALTVEAGKGLVVTGTVDGRVLVYDSNDLTLIEEFRFTASPDGNAVTGIYIRNSNEIWAESQSCGVVRMDLRSRSYKICEFPCGSKGGRTSACIGENRSGEILALGSEEIFKFSEPEGRFVLSDNFDSAVCHFRCLYVDNNGGLWLGTFYNGVYYYYSNPTPFSDLSLGLPGKDVLVCSIRETPEKKMWISTMKYGVLEYDPAGRGLSEVPQSDKVLSSGVMDILFADDGRRALFANTQGLTLLDRRTGRYSFPKSRSQTHLPPMYSMAKENSSLIWVGSLAGMYLYDTSSGTVEPVPGTEHLFIFKILLDGADRMWMATADGLYHAEIIRPKEGNPGLRGITRESGAFEAHDILKSQGRMYVAARNGLFVLDRKGEWGHFTREDGLSTNFLNGLEADNDGIIWISTEFGLDSFNPADGRIHHYLREDGVNVEYYTKNAHCIASGGMMYFGGIGGVCRVDTDIESAPRCSEKPVINRVIINGVGQQNNGEKLTLNHQMNTVSFEFYVPNYSSGKKSTFKYKLQGADTDWRTTRQFKSVIYSSLRPGRYQLVLKSTNMDGMESAEPASMDIRILRPWYSSVVACFIYLLLLLSAILFAIHRVALNSRASALSKMNHLKVLSFTGRPVSPDDEEFMLKAINLIEENIFKGSFGVEQMAEQMKMSRSGLFMRFKKITGGSVMDVIKRIRFEKACTLLSTTDKTMDEISGEVGFQNASYFTSAFKQFIGETPTKWRESNR